MSFFALRPEPFYNRRHELAALDRAWRHPGAAGQMALLYGRRRLGKTFLLQRFFAGGDGADGAAKPHCYYLAEQTTAASQRLALATQVLTALPDPGIQGPEELAVSWNAILRHVSSQCRRQAGSAPRFGLILDEFPYLVDQSLELPSMLQSWWDREGVHCPVFVILCGSHLSAMAALGAQSAPLFGRFNAGILLLSPLRYDEVAPFYDNSSLYGRSEKLIMFGVLGGTPRYHALVDTSRPMAEEISDNSTLINERASTLTRQRGIVVPMPEC